LEQANDETFPIVELRPAASLDGPDVALPERLIGIPAWTEAQAVRTRAFTLDMGMMGIRHGAHDGPVRGGWARSAPAAAEPIAMWRRSRCRLRHALVELGDASVETTGRAGFPMPDRQDSMWAVAQSCERPSHEGQGGTANT
jgi:hypothetical protein